MPAPRPRQLSAQGHGAVEAARTRSSPTTDVTEGSRILNHGLLAARVAPALRLGRDARCPEVTTALETPATKRARPTRKAPTEAVGAASGHWEQRPDTARRGRSTPPDLGGSRP